MSEKWQRRSIQTFAFLVGLLFGLFRPDDTQTVLPVIGIVVGIGYFFVARITTQQDKELEDIPWFLFIQMLMYFLIGSAITSTILLALQMM